MATYLRKGVSLVWVADSADCSIKTHGSDGGRRLFRIGEKLDGGDVLPGFRVPVAEFFK